MRTIKRLFFLLAFLPALAVAQQAEVLTLPQILQHIDSNNLQLKIYEDRAESYRYRGDAATAWMAPMVGLGTWQTPYPGQKVMNDDDKGMIMFRAAQTIPNRSKQRAQKRYIESQGDVERAGRAVTLNNLKSEARKAYYNWLVADQTIKMLRRNEQVLTMIKKIEEVRYPYNQSQLSSIYQSDATIEDNRAMMQMYLGTIVRSKGYLNALMNRPGNTDFTIDTTVDVRFQPSLQTDTAALALARKDVLQMNWSIRSMQLNIEAMKQQRKPDFSIQFDHMSPVAGMMPHSFGVMGMVSIPIAPWASKMYKSEIKAMELDIRAMQNERAAMLQETGGMLYGMQGEIQSMQRRIASVETKVLPALQKTFDANFILYQENKLSITALLSSWEALNMMQIDLQDQRAALYQMIGDYEKELYRD